MSNKKNRNAKADADRLAEFQAAETRARLDAFEQAMDTREQQSRARAEQLLDAERQQLAQERLEHQAQQMETYRAQAIAVAVSNKSLAPQVADMIPAGMSSREDIDAAVQLGIAKTAEIAAEVSGQAPAAGQSRDELGRFVPQQPVAAPAEQYMPEGTTADELAKIQAGTYSLEDHARMRNRVGLGHRDTGIFH